MSGVQTARGCAAHLPAVHLSAPGHGAAAGREQRCVLARPPRRRARRTHRGRARVALPCARHGRTGAHPQGPVDRAAGARGDPGRAARVGGRRGRRARHEEQARLRRAQRLLRLRGRRARSAAARRLGLRLPSRGAPPQPRRRCSRGLARPHSGACPGRRRVPVQYAQMAPQTRTPAHTFTRRKRARRPACAFAALEG